MSKRVIQGSCFCGKIQYEFELPSKFLAHCHCSECRRANGAPFVTWAGTHEEKFRVTKGSENLVRFEYPENSKEASREFCGICGSQLFFRGSSWPNEVHVTMATVHDALDREVQAHVFYSDKANWLDLKKDLPLYGGKTGLEPIKK